MDRQILGSKHFDLAGAKGTALRFRPERLTPAALDVCKAQVRCPDIDDGVPHNLINVSASGAAFELSPTEVVHGGQVLSSFSIMLDGITLYDGRVTIVNQRTHDDTVVCGVAFLDAYLPSGALASTSRVAAAIREFSQKLSDVETILGAGVDDWVKVLAADFRLFLASLRRTFDTVVPTGASSELEDGVVRFVEAELAPIFHDFIHQLNAIPQRVPFEHIGAVRAYLKAQLQELLLPAPIYRQSYFKPLGYAGDYVTMNMLYGSHYQGETAYAKFLNRMMCDLSASRAVVSRVKYLEDWIARVVGEKGGGHARVLSVASGPAQEMQNYLAKNAPTDEVTLSLFDQDPRALGYAQSKLAPLASRFGGRLKVSYIHAGVRQLVLKTKVLESLRGQDLIYSAGLFDYLRSDVAVVLLTRLFSLLAKGGALVIGNLGQGCDSQGIFENLGDWEIIYRSNQELEALACRLSPSSVQVESEATGINSFLVLRR